MDFLEPYRKEISKESINALPMVSYEGPIYLVERAEELQPALEHLKDDALLGLDTEMRPCFERGKAPYPTALLQLAGEKAVVLVRVQRVPLSGALTALLEDPEIKKVGVAIGDDMRLLRRNAPFHPGGLVDLAAAAKQAGLKTLGLRPLAANFLNVRISKNAQCSNWERPELSAQQIVYAATDAWIGREIYLRMSAVPGIQFPPVIVSENVPSLKKRHRVFTRRSRRPETPVSPWARAEEA